MTIEEFQNLKDLTKLFFLNKDKLLELENLELDLKEQEKSLYIKLKNLDRLKDKTNNLYKNQVSFNHNFQELEKLNEILCFKSRNTDNLEGENYSLKQEIIRLNQELKKKSEELDSANSTIETQ